MKGSCDALHATLLRERQRMSQYECELRSLQVENLRLRDALRQLLTQERPSAPQAAAVPCASVITIREYASLLEVARAYRQTLLDVRSLQAALSEGGGSLSLFLGLPIPVPDLPLCAFVSPEAESTPPPQTTPPHRTEQSHSRCATELSPWAGVVSDETIIQSAGTSPAAALRRRAVCPPAPPSPLTRRRKPDFLVEPPKESEEPEDANGYPAVSLGGWQGPMHQHAEEPPHQPRVESLGTGKRSSNELEKEVERTDDLTKAFVEELRALAAEEQRTTSGLSALCQSRGLDFMDVDFPPITASLGPGGCRCFDPLTQQSYVVRWCSRSVYTPSHRRAALLTSVGVDPCALRVGCLGDRGVTAALAALAESRGAVTSILASTSLEDEANGLFSVWLTKCGLWTLVPVDAFLPCVDTCRDEDTVPPVPYGCSNRLAWDLWGPVCEKAIAKARGSYRALVGLHAAAALGYFTGGPVEEWNWWRRRSSAAFAEMEAAIHTSARGSGIVLLTTRTYEAATAKESMKEVAAALSTAGLTPGTTYRVLSVAIGPQGNRMVLLRNWERHSGGGVAPTAEGIEVRRSPTRGDDYTCLSDHVDGRVAHTDSSCTWLSFESEVLPYFSECHVCFDCRRYHDMRVVIPFSRGQPAVPRYLVRITVRPHLKSEPARLWIGLYQPPPSGPHGAAAVKLVLLGHDDSRKAPRRTEDAERGGSHYVLSESYGGAYQRMPVVWMYVELETSPSHATVIYVIPRLQGSWGEDGLSERVINRMSGRSHQDAASVLAVLAETRSSVSVEIIESPEELTAALCHALLERIDLEACAAVGCASPVGPRCQVNGQWVRGCEW